MTDVFSRRPDDGYSAICGFCGAGHTPRPELIGLPRELAWRECPKCDTRQRDKAERNRRNQEPLYRSYRAQCKVVYDIIP